MGKGIWLQGTKSRWQGQSLQLHSCLRVPLTGLWRSVGPTRGIRSAPQHRSAPPHSNATSSSSMRLQGGIFEWHWIEVLWKRKWCLLWTLLRWWDYSERGAMRLSIETLFTDSLKVSEPRTILLSILTLGDFIGVFSRFVSLFLPLETQKGSVQWKLCLRN